MCETLRARPAMAADFFSRLMDESPASPLAAEALYRYGVALSHLEDPAEAMLALERVRTRFADSRFAPKALDRITLLHRLRLRPTLPRASAGAKPEGPATARRVGGGQPAPPPDPPPYRPRRPPRGPPPRRARRRAPTDRGALRPAP